jgi:hypothetical protein
MTFHHDHSAAIDAFCRLRHDVQGRHENKEYDRQVLHGRFFLSF